MAEDSKRVSIQYDPPQEVWEMMDEMVPEHDTLRGRYQRLIDSLVFKCHKERFGEPENK